MADVASLAVEWPARPAQVDRRGFLRRVGWAGAAAVGGGGLVAAACSRPGSAPGGSAPGGSPSTSGSTTRTSRSGLGGAPDWRVLAGSLTGTLLRPGDAAYTGATHQYNELLSSQPAAVAQCASVSDVQRCLDFARAHEVPLAARSGGHSYAGYSSSSGLVIDVSPLHALTVLEARPSGGAGAGIGAGPGAGVATVRVGAGTRLMDLYSALAGRGWLLPGGSCPTVGIAGLALGGGIGVFGRAFGLTCDQMAGVELVTADGVRHQCGMTAQEDLYWACRGGGGGNFGVVTSFDFWVQSIPPAITLFTLEWPWGAAASVLDAWLRWIPFTPDELWANLQMYTTGTVGQGLLKVTGVFAGTVAACTAALTPLTAAVGEATSSRFVGPESYLRAMMIEGGCEGQPVAQCDAPVQSPFAAKSSYLGGALPSAMVAALVSAVSEVPAMLPGAAGGIVFDGYGGAINRVGAAATAFVHRAAVACAQYLITYSSAQPSPATRAAASAWLARVERIFEPVTQGSYQNYIDPSLSGWQHAYYGSNLPRLQRVKQARDPDDVFRFAQSIPLPSR